VNGAEQQRGNQALDEIETAQSKIIVAAHQIVEGAERVLTRESALSLAATASVLSALLTEIADFFV
jgi:hypothetical protein